jgi:protein-L-isoaspartate(D-aspartate) O-methyltransferase
VFKRLVGAAVLLVFFGALPMGQVEAGDDEFIYARQRHMLIRDQLKTQGIRDERVLQAMEKVKRHLFIDKSLRNAAYEDTPLPIGQGQTISQPYIVGYMTQALHLKPTDRVLEIGTGSGYQAAILAELVQEVYTIEIVPELAESAQKRLEDMGYNNIFVREGDGYKGWEEHAPYDAIILTAAPDEVPGALLDQLVIGGRLIAPVGSFFQDLYLYTKTEKGIEKKSLMPVRFVPMVEGD